MRVAALYDIHGNDAALAAVLAEIETLGVDLIVVGGDVAGGAFPCETVDAVRALGDRAVTIRGNGERELVEARLRLDAGSARIDADDVWSSRTHWAAGVLDRERLEWMGALPPLSSVEIDGLGDVLFCHASPRSDEDIITPLSPEARIAPMLAGVSQRTIVLGHTHVQFDLRARDPASSTPAASACRTPTRRPRTGRCSARRSSCAAPPTTSRRSAPACGRAASRTRGVRRRARPAAGRGRRERVLRAYGDAPAAGLEGVGRGGRVGDGTRGERVGGGERRLRGGGGGVVARGGGAGGGGGGGAAPIR